MASDESAEAETDASGASERTASMVDDPTESASDDLASTPDVESGLDRDFSGVVDVMSEVVADEELNGAGLVIVERDEGIVFEHYEGVFGPDRVSLIASASKSITAAVLMALDDQGLLDVEAPVADVVEWGSAHPSITPIQLISNSSGLMGLGPDAPYWCQYGYVGTMQDCAEAVFLATDDDDETVPPDTEFRYGGGQWQVAGAVAEVAAGRSWSELVDELIAEPCGIASLGYNNHFLQFPDNENPFGHPSGFDGDASVLRRTENPNMEGGAYISVHDYAALLLMHLNEGRCGEQQVLSPEAVSVMHADRIAEAYEGETDAGLEGYGLGWWIDRDEPGLISDGGAFGAFPWLDVDAGYGAYLVVESTNDVSRTISEQIVPLIAEQMTGAS